MRTVHRTGQRHCKLCPLNSACCVSLLELARLGVLLVRGDAPGAGTMLFLPQRPPPGADGSELTNQVGIPEARKEEDEKACVGHAHCEDPPNRGKTRDRLARARAAQFVAVALIALCACPCAKRAVTAVDRAALSAVQARGPGRLPVARAAVGKVLTRARPRARRPHFGVLQHVPGVVGHYQQRRDDGEVRRPKPQAVRRLPHTARGLAVHKDHRKGKHHQVDAKGNPVPEEPRGAGDAPAQERNHQRRPASRANERRDGEDERRKRDYEAAPLGILRALAVRLLLVLGLPAPLAPGQQARAFRARAAIGGGRASVEALLRRNGHARTLRARHVSARHHFTVVADERRGHFCVRVGCPITLPLRRPWSPSLQVCSVLLF